MSGADNSGRGRKSKVAKLIAQYDIGNMGEELEQKWTAEGEERRSLRALADEFNQRLTREALENAGVQTVNGEVENAYRVLTDEEASSADRTRLARRLKRDGVDVDGLTADFVSYQAIRTYLHNHRNVSYDGATGADDQRQRASETIQRLQSRTTAVAETKIEQLRNTEEFTLGEFRVINDVRVVCTECDNRYVIGDLLTGDGCACS